MIFSMSANSLTLPPGYVLLTEGRTAPSRRWLFWACLAQIGLLVPQVTGFLQWATRQGMLPVPPVLVVGCMLLINVWLLLPRKPMVSKTSLLIIILCSMRLIDAICHRFGLLDTFAAMLTRVSLTLVFVLASILICGVARQDSVLPLCSAATISILVSSAANLAELAGHIKNSSVPGRAAGFIPDANDSAIAIICMLALLLTLQRNFWFSVVMIGVALAGIMPTLSRSGFLVFTLILATFFVQNLRKHSGKIIAASACFFLLGCLAVAIIGSSSNNRNDVNVQERIRAIFGGDTQKLESSERMKDLNDGVEGAMLRPIFGHGLGAGSGGGHPQQWRPHNQFVSLWIELGIIGAGVYTIILLALLWKACTRPSATLICIIPVIAFLPFSQTLTDTAAYWLVAIMAALLSSVRPIQFSLWRPQSQSSSIPHGLTS